MPRHAYVHEATVLLGGDTNPAAVGAAVTVALCGHWDHEGPCRWPHLSQMDGTRFRTIFVATDDDEPDVRRRIRAALHGQADWRVESDRSRDVAEDEQVLAAQLFRAPGLG